MNRPIPQENGRVLFAAAALWGTVVAAAAVEGVMDMFEPTELGVFAGLVSAFAWIAYRVDDELRAFAQSVTTRKLLAWSIAMGAAWIAAGLAQLGALAIFLAPLVAFEAAALADRPNRAAVRKSSAKSPGARPAAT